MPQHEFGIMQTAPIKGKRYDSYEPEKYGCISVDDDYILPLLEEFKNIKCYWHTLDKTEFGFAYYGITLIPPESLDGLIAIIWSNSKLSDLMALLKEAEANKKFVIHFGI